ncbi:MAG: ribokinase [Pseudomonadota bacterium]
MIVVIGSINMDLVWRVPRMPLPGETLAGATLLTVPGGKGANQAVACARLSAAHTRVAMIGCLGDDAFGVTLRATLRADGIDERHVTTLSGVASGVASILVDSAGQNSIVLAAGANALLNADHIDAARALIEQASIVLLQLEIPLATVAHAIGLAHSLGKTVVLNPAPAATLPAELLAMVDYLIPNEIEAAMLAGAPACEHAQARQPPALAARLRAAGCRTVLITLGAQGVLAALGEHPARLFAAHAAAAVDTTAAGDTFIGAFSAALAAGRGELEAIAFGQRAAAISVTRSGAQTSIPHLHEMEHV